jgi:uncharacterized damage-inducible protein DinB
VSAAPGPEAWLRGPVDGIPPLLQPVAHALVQARAELRALAADLPPERLWTRPGDVASAGFHLRHLTGVLDRLLTYARGEPLTQPQLDALAAEPHPPADGGTDAAEVAALVAAFDAQVDRALAQLRATDERTLLETRHVGRGRLPSTVLGLLFHAAEHTMRHLGQLLVTVRVQRDPRVGG